LQQEIQSGSERLIQRFEMENKKLSKEFAEKIKLETSRLYANLELVKNDSEK
jgi:hypothetical protein